MAHRRDRSNELIVAIVVIGTLALALTFGIILSLSSSSGDTSDIEDTSTPPGLSSADLTAGLKPSPTFTPTKTASPTRTPEPTRTLIPPSHTRAAPSTMPSVEPTVIVAVQPSETPLPTATSTDTPSPEPSETPVPTPTLTETPLPSETPSPEPTETPRPAPTETDTPSPTTEPSETPRLVLMEETDTPSPEPTETREPTATETETPSPTPEPSETPVPTATVTDTPIPTDTPTATPTDTPVPTDTPSVTPTDTPVPTDAPTATSTDTPIPSPTDTPSQTPTETLTPTPSMTLTFTPYPTLTPSVTPFAGEQTATPSASGCLVPDDWIEYIIQSGNTMYGLSRRFGLTVSDLAGANCIEDPSNITAGQILFVPPGSDVTPPQTGTIIVPPVVVGNFARFDCGDPSWTITQPGPGTVLHGTFAVYGTAVHPQFSFYRLQISGGSIEDADFATLQVYTTPMINGELGTVNPAAFAPGDYWLRLTVVDVTGNYPPQCTVRVRFAP